MEIDGRNMKEKFTDALNGLREWGNNLNDRQLGVVLFVAGIFLFLTLGTIIEGFDCLLGMIVALIGVGALIMMTIGFILFVG